MPPSATACYAPADIYDIILLSRILRRCRRHFRLLAAFIYFDDAIAADYAIVITIEIPDTPPRRAPLPLCFHAMPMMLLIAEPLSLIR